MSSIVDYKERYPVLPGGAEKRSWRGIPEACCGLARQCPCLRPTLARSQSHPMPGLPTQHLASSDGIAFARYRERGNLGGGTCKALKGFRK